MGDAEGAMHLKANCETVVYLIPEYMGGTNTG